MSTKEVYEKYKHLDGLLSDKRWLDTEAGFINNILHELWAAIKEARKQTAGEEGGK